MDGLDDLFGPVGLGDPDGPVDGGGSFEEPPQREHLQGCGDEDGHGEAPVDHAQAQQGHGDSEGCAGERRQHSGNGLADSLDIAGHAGHNIADARLFQLRQGLPDGCREDLLAEPGKGFLADPGQQVLAQDAQQGAASTRNQQADGQPQQGHDVSAAGRDVDHDAQDRRRCQSAAGRRQQDEHGQGEPAGALCQQAPHGPPGLTGRGNGQDLGAHEPTTSR